MISKFYQLINIIMHDYQLHFIFILLTDSLYSVLIIVDILKLRLKSCNRRSYWWIRNNHIGGDYVDGWHVTKFTTVEDHSKGYYVIDETIIQQ